MPPDPVREDTGGGDRWVNGFIELVVPLEVSVDADRSAKSDALTKLMDDVTDRLGEPFAGHALAGRWEDTTVDDRGAAVAIAAPASSSKDEEGLPAVPFTTDRYGVKTFEAIEGTHGQHVFVAESVAITPHAWLAMGTAAAHLSIDDVERLIVTLRAALGTHAPSVSQQRTGEGEADEWKRLALRLAESVPHDHSEATSGSTWTRDGVTHRRGNPEGRCPRCPLDREIAALLASSPDDGQVAT